MSATLALALPVTVFVTDRGAVTVENATRVVGMSPFSERAGRLTLAFGPGVHILEDAVDVAALDAVTASDVADCLAN
jgi:hypothetical protein